MKIDRNELKKNLVDHILPFWMNLLDPDYGGFYGRVDYNLTIIPHAPKSSIINSRILWSFSTAYNFLKEGKYKIYADHAYKFMIDKLLDKKFGGLYLFTDYKGEVIDKRKHINNISYSIYALAEYYKITNDLEVRSLASKFFELIESKKDNCGFYSEEFDEQWNKKSNDFLDRYDLHAEFTLNNYIHILESYSALYEIWKSDHLLDRIKFLLETIESKIYSPARKTFNEFFDSNWHSLVDLKIFGHDIELTWLLSRALEITKLKNPNILTIVHNICKNVQQEALENNSVILESLNGHKNKIRMWWVQTEAIIGFYNAYELFNDETFLNTAITIWNFVKNRFIDTRNNS